MEGDQQLPIIIYRMGPVRANNTRYRHITQPGSSRGDDSPGTLVTRLNGLSDEQYNAVERLVETYMGPLDEFKIRLHEIVQLE